MNLIKNLKIAAMIAKLATMTPGSQEINFCILNICGPSIPPSLPHSDPNPSARVRISVGYSSVV